MTVLAFVLGAVFGAACLLVFAVVTAAVWDLPTVDVTPASEVVAAHTGNVRVLPAHCGCGDSTTLGVVHRPTAPCYIPSDAS